jgi:hypothetical protein
MFGIQFMGKLLSAGWGFGRIEDERNTFEHAFEAGNLLLQMTRESSFRVRREKDREMRSQSQA